MKVRLETSANTALIIMQSKSTEEPRKKIGKGSKLRVFGQLFCLLLSISKSYPVAVIKN